VHVQYDVGSIKEKRRRKGGEKGGKAPFPVCNKGKSLVM